MGSFCPKICPLSHCAGDLRTWSTPMLDVVMLTLGFGFFALTVGYAFACDRL
jgi:hypothetical protein